MPANRAAWLVAEAAPLEVKEAPYVSPGANQILIKNGAVAINPVDWALQGMGAKYFPWLKYPAIIGSDIAGEGQLSENKVIYLTYMPYITSFVV
jgi:NADPH:quinone reductase-like Zn-dependent oxidoreductase